MKPKLRELEITPTPEGYVLRDPYGISEEVLVLSPEAMYLASLLDGTRDVVELQAHILNTSGSLIPREKLEELVRGLERAGFLETPEFAQKLAEAERAFTQQESRPMALAGVSYPAEAKGFTAYLQAFRALVPEGTKGAVRGVVMPHLEPRRVPEVYGAVLEALAHTPPPARVLVAGVAHHPIQEVAAALPLAFDTPLGRVEVDLEALGALDALVPFELFNTPLAFREEHSVEFPVVFLKGVWPEASFKILPLIVSGSEEASALEELARALEVLAKDYPFLPVASVDLSHVGARFGHGPLTRALATRAQSMDRRYLELVAGGEFDRAFLDVTLPKNPTGIDAYATVHALKAVLRGTGEVVAYRFSAEVETLSAVGAGAVLYR